MPEVKPHDLPGSSRVLGRSELEPFRPLGGFFEHHN
jgi:hypothetical protein